ncbi:MAG TPA: hypothetical protein ENN13_03745 [Candidatus Altiarchaeales archaeon]|nr:hypothetical protein [Candidatus Altiarchaeales archaeon]
MRKNALISAGVMAAVMLVVFAAVNLSGGKSSDGEYYTQCYIESFSSDKFLYRSKEIIVLNVEVQSKEEFEGVLWVHGIYSRRDRINRRESVGVIDGFNSFTIEERLPSCTGCSGIRPGNYTITAELTDSLNRTVGETIVVRIEQ